MLSLTPSLFRELTSLHRSNHQRSDSPIPSLTLRIIQQYQAIPDMIKPVRGQPLTSHAPGIDLTPQSSPVIRDALTTSYRYWLIPGTIGQAATSVGWTKGVNAAVTIDPRSGRRCLTQEFYAHGTDPDNWSLDASIAEL
ncbi:hypothetical protein B0J12DRAFT_77688 [Macrophomina phaseolina]|uniref:Uncharacterized protein n=1 Tax=Macrophomina phaseolina TaxID=35725 RepID=A0ABQ8GE24_9PEZI|nr:hypothetical protein B0J12DRAFT_77688 [Macrophomina phaseolina]